MSFLYVLGASEVCVYKDMGGRISFRLPSCQGRGLLDRWRDGFLINVTLDNAFVPILERSAVELPSGSGGVVCPVQLLRSSSLPSPWVLPSLCSIFTVSRLHLFAVLVSGKFYIRQSNLHRHNQRDVRITAYSWLLLACEEKAKFMVNTELRFWTLVILIQLSLVTFLWWLREGIRNIGYFVKKTPKLVRASFHTIAQNNF